VFTETKPETYSIFLLHDVMHKRGLCLRAVSVCIAVRRVREFRRNE